MIGYKKNCDMSYGKKDIWYDSGEEYLKSW